MVVDTSALFAILFKEPEAELFKQLIAQDPVRLISAATLLEATVVIESRRGEAGGNLLDLFLLRTGFEIVPVDADQVEVARYAWRHFGKGRHPARLNFGDCFAYALAAIRREPLLFKGEDFSRTDVPRF